MEIIWVGVPLKCIFALVTCILSDCMLGTSTQECASGNSVVVQWLELHTQPNKKKRSVPHGKSVGGVSCIAGGIWASGKAQFYKDAFINALGLYRNRHVPRVSNQKFRWALGLFGKWLLGGRSVSANITPNSLKDEEAGVHILYYKRWKIQKRLT